MDTQEQASQTTDFDTFISSQNLPVLTDFWADWCQPCHMMSPVLKDLAKDWKGRLKVIKVNTEKKPELANRFGISGIPTFILFKEGREVHRVSGAMPLAHLKRELESRL
jgi:thioredoxin 1